MSEPKRAAFDRATLALCQLEQEGEEGRAPWEDRALAEIRQAVEEMGLALDTIRTFLLARPDKLREWHEFLRLVASLKPQQMKEK